MKRDFNFWNSLKIQYANATAIARATEINIQTVYWNLKKYGISSGPKADTTKKLANISKEELIRKYLELNSLDRLGEFYGITGETLRHRIPQELLGENRCDKATCDKDFFSRDNELSFYYAGFLAADGCLKLKGGKYKQVQLTLAAADGDVVRRFANAIRYSGTVHDYTLNEIKNDGTNIRKTDLQISSDELFNDLHRFGLAVRKTHTFSMPQWLIEHQLVHHFLRGYFDGDGSAYISQPKGARTIKQVHINIRGTEEFLTQMRDIFDAKIAAGKWKKAKPIRFNNGIGVLEYGGNAATLAISDYLYRDATVWMERKRAKFEEARGFTVSAREARIATDAAKRGAPSMKHRRPIIATNLQTGEELHLTGAPEAVERFGATYSGVRGCLSGRQKQHRGWVFRYASATNI